MLGIIEGVLYVDDNMSRWTDCAIRHRGVSFEVAQMSQRFLHIVARVLWTKPFDVLGEGIMRDIPSIQYGAFRLRVCGYNDSRDLFTSTAVEFCSDIYRWADDEVE